jgi:hypothetical protein
MESKEWEAHMMRLRDKLATELDPDAFKVPSSTWNYAAAMRERRFRQMVATERAGEILREISLAVDQEYVRYCISRSGSC